MRALEEHVSNQVGTTKPTCKSHEISIEIINVTTVLDGDIKQLIVHMEVVMLPGGEQEQNGMMEVGNKNPGVRIVESTSRFGIIKKELATRPRC